MFPATRAGVSEAIKDTHDNANPPENENLLNERGVIMAVYVFVKDASLPSGMEPVDRVIRAAQDLETGASQALCENQMAGGSAFCYFWPRPENKVLPGHARVRLALPRKRKRCNTVHKPRHLRRGAWRRSQTIPPPFPAIRSHQYFYTATFRRLKHCPFIVMTSKDGHYHD
ncbi:hypothetical protein B0H63DRAFT_524686 [Podospora didyma]|uniref:Uncharacterized protein n=1 Tax=Podospora didyma TaxID=330526 RepID=A0AAE0NI99_9PEZI|nr:hypothetical protein B0H63DRAFT_524686 [Podospora didyma]